jgi:hypothetical protein
VEIVAIFLLRYGGIGVSKEYNCITFDRSFMHAFLGEYLLGPVTCQRRVTCGDFSPTLDLHLTRGRRSCAVEDCREDTLYLRLSLPNHTP